MKLLRFAFEFLRALAILALLPLAPAPDDRILAAAIYRRALGSMGVWRETRRYWSLCLWLNRAAARQERINSINLPAYRELCRRKWQRSYTYPRAAKSLASLWAIAYGGDWLEEMLKIEFPAFYQVISYICRLMLEEINRLLESMINLLHNT